MNLVMIEKIVGLAVIMTASVVGFLTILHGDIALGMLVVLGQLQTMVSGHHGRHNPQEEATHLIAHQKF